MRLSGMLQFLILVLLLLCSINLMKLIADFMAHHRQTDPDSRFIRQNRPKPRFSRLSSNLYVFSSFVDARNGNMGFPFFRIIAIIRKTYRKYYCIFKNHRIQAQIYEMAENHNLPFGAYILNCRIPPHFMITSSKIGLTDGSKILEVSPTYYIPAENSPTLFAYNFAICLPFLYGNYYGAEYLLEVIEMFKVLGAQQITVYTTKWNLDDKVQKVLNYYEAQSVLDVIDPKLPAVDIWNHAQLVFINDCLYRNVGRAKFVAFQDWDEIIVPTRDTVLPPVFEKIFANSSVASSRILTKYIHFDLIEQFSRNYSSLMNSVRGGEELDTKYTKCVLRPEMVFEQGIHHTSRVIQDNYLSVELPSYEAVLHHYVEEINDRELTSLVTTVPYKYGEKLLRNCDAVLRKIMNTDVLQQSF